MQRSHSLRSRYSRSRDFFMRYRKRHKFTRACQLLICSGNAERYDKKKAFLCSFLCVENIPLHKYTYKATLFDKKIIHICKIRAIFLEGVANYSRFARYARRKGDEFYVGRETKYLSPSEEEKWVVSQRTIVARRERSLRTPSSYSAEHGPR